MRRNKYTPEKGQSLCFPIFQFSSFFPSLTTIAPYTQESGKGKRKPLAENLLLSPYYMEFPVSNERLQNNGSKKRKRMESTPTPERRGRGKAMTIRPPTSPRKTHPFGTLLLEAAQITRRDLTEKNLFFHPLCHGRDSDWAHGGEEARPLTPHPHRPILLAGVRRHRWLGLLLVNFAVVSWIRIEPSQRRPPRVSMHARFLSADTWPCRGGDPRIRGEQRQRRCSHHRTLGPLLACLLTLFSLVPLAATSWSNCVAGSQASEYGCPMHNAVTRLSPKRSQQHASRVPTGGVGAPFDIEPRATDATTASLPFCSSLSRSCRLLNPARSDLIQALPAECTPPRDFPPRDHGDDTSALSSDKVDKVGVPPCSEEA